MDEDPRVDSLVARWEEQRQHGEKLSAAELCRDCPELLPQVEPIIQAFLKMAPLLLETGAPPTVLAGNRAGASTAVPEVAGYEILGELGRGAMGVVYRVRHQQLNRVVALKMIRAGAHADAQDLQRFLAEAEAVAKLRHAHIVQLYDYGQHNGLPYFTLEFVAGGSLQGTLRAGPLLHQDAARIVEQLAHGMHHAHEHGIVHRDLKPGNVLLQMAAGEARPADSPGKPPTRNLQSAVPKIADFGLVKRLQSVNALTASGAVMGTPSYMAPEQASGDGKRVGPAADIYALGAILYECLAGRPPFQGPTIMDTLQQVQNSEPVPPRRLQPNVPRDLETVCLKCLRKEPHKRYASAAELAEDLRRFQAGEPIQARPVGPVERATKWVRRRPAVATLMACLLLLLSGTVAAGAWYWLDRADRAAALAHEDAIRQARAATIDHEVRAVLGNGAALQDQLHQHLADPLQTASLLSDMDQWGLTLANARTAWHQARSLALSNQDVVEPDVSMRLQDLDKQLQTDEKGYLLARELDTIRLRNSEEVIDGKWDPASAAPQYAAVFAGQDLDFERGDPAPMAAAIRQSPVRYALVAALDDWAAVMPTTAPKDRELASMLLAVARQADPDPWRDQVRDAAAAADLDKLKQLAAKAKPAQQAPHLLGALALHLHHSAGDALPLLARPCCTTRAIFG